MDEHDVGEPHDEPQNPWKGEPEPGPTEPVTEPLGPPNGPATDPLSVPPAPLSAADRDHGLWFATEAPAPEAATWSGRSRRSFRAAVATIVAALVLLSAGVGIGWELNRAGPGTTVRGTDWR